MKMQDKTRKVKIELCVWDGNGYGPDFSQDFFEAGGLKHNDETDCYIVPDIEYCIDQANDMINHQGDFNDGEEPDGNTRLFVTELE